MLYSNIRNIRLLQNVRFSLLLFSVFLFFPVASDLQGAAGDLDSSFGNTTAGISTDWFYESGIVYGRGVAFQSDGKIVAVGYANDGKYNNFAVCRYNSDGSLDSTFGENGKVVTKIGSSTAEAKAVAIQSDGKIVVVGWYYNGSDYDFAVVRYNSDGSGDKMVGTNIGSDDRAYAVAIQADGKIVVGGESSEIFAVIRYDTDLTLDTTFDSDGKVTTSLSSDVDTIYSILIQSDGKIVAGGGTDRAAQGKFGLVRYNSDGSLDTSFGTGGKVTKSVSSASDCINSLCLQSDGKIIAGGGANNTSDTSFALLRFLSDGTLDTTFDSDGMVFTSIETYNTGTAVKLCSDDTILLAGYTKANIAGDGNFTVVKYKNDGSLDTTFGTNGIATTDLGADDVAYAMDVDSNDAPVLVGKTDYDTGGCAVVCYKSDGSLDTSFDSDGIVITTFPSTDDVAKAIGVQSDGKIIVSGYSKNATTSKDVFALLRYSSAGILDTTFGTDGKTTTAFDTETSQDVYATSMAVKSDDRIIIGGYTEISSANGNDFILACYDSDGALDTTFDTDGKVSTDFNSNYDRLNGVAVQSDGKIVAVGYTNGDTYDFAAARYNTDGSLDTTFGGGGKATLDLSSGGDDFAYAVAVQSDGKIVVVGFSNDNTGADEIAVVRYNSDGTRDTSFDGNGIVTTPIGSASAKGYAVTIQSDGKIVVVGTADGGSTFAAVRYNSDGSLDTSFDTDGIVTTAFPDSNIVARSVNIQPDGSILLTGYSNAHDAVLVRYKSDGSLDTSFATTGKKSFGGRYFYQCYASVIQSGGVLLADTSGDFSTARIELTTPPEIAIDDSTLSFTTGDPATPVDSAATLNDADGDSDWDGGTLTVQITANNEAADTLTIPDNQVGTINTSGTNLQDGATVIGTLSASEGSVTDGDALTITFNSNATNTLVQQVVRAIYYQNTSGTPGTGDRTVTFTATDKVGGTASDTRTIGIVHDPAVTTEAVADIALTTATGNGTVSDLGFPYVTQHGVCWNTAGTPTIADSKTEEGIPSATGAFTTEMTGLSKGTTYYVRSYVTNSAGTFYGSEESFTTLSWTVTFQTDGTSGASLAGSTLQYVANNGNCTAVTANIPTGYSFTGWSGGYVGTENPLTVTNVTDDMTITANFAINTYTLTYTAGANGSISGINPQTVNYGADGTAVTAVPDSGYGFVEWSDGVTDNPRTDTNVTADISVSASFALGTYTLTVTNGSGDGTYTPGRKVSVVADTVAGMTFSKWTDDAGGTFTDSTASTTTYTMPSSNATVTATFTVDPSTADKITYGSLLTVNASDIANGDDKFYKKPKIYGVYTDPIKLKEKNATAKGVSKIDKNALPTTYQYAWNKCVYLYSKSDLKAANKATPPTTTAAWLTAHPIADLDCSMWIKMTKQDKRKIEELFKGVVITPPSITSVTCWDGNAIASGVHPGSNIIVNGTYFGYRNPSIALEYTDDKGKLKQNKLKILKVYKYDDMKGKSEKSCMELDATSADYGISYVRAEIPKNMPTGTYSVVLTNKVGIDTASVTVTAAETVTNSAPVAKDDAITVTAGEKYYYIDIFADNGSGVDEDADSDTLDVTFGNDGASTGGGKLKYDKNRFKVKYVPPKDAVAPYSDTFTYTLSDGISNTTSTGTVSVTVNP